MKSKEILLYLPVPHAGYIDLIKRHSPYRVSLLHSIFLRDLEYLSRDVRALEPEIAAAALRAALKEEGFSIDVRVFAGGWEFDFSDVHLIMPDEDISHLFAEKYLQGVPVEWDNAFLRWNMKNVTKEFPVDPDEEVSFSEIDRYFIGLAKETARKSPDWWRQVGAVVSLGEVVIALSNSHQPSCYTCSIDGDPRSPFRPGERIDVSAAEHAEMAIISYFARSSFSLEGARVYVSVFPCPNCARALASAGVKEIYYSEGYSLVNAREVLRARKVRVIRVVD